MYIKCRSLAEIITQEKAIIKECKNISRYYKKRYNIKIDDLYIGNDVFQSRYDEKEFYIQISITQVKQIISELRDRSQRQDIKDLVIFTLLHELKHAIDHQKNTGRFLSEIYSIDIIKYIRDKKYHHSRPFEIRADEFARQELNKWV